VGIAHLHAPVDESAPKFEVRAGEPLDVVERKLILRTLKHVGGRRDLAAASLGIGKRTLYDKLKRYESEGHAVPAAS
jgi:DNA-binding NtrC family response regulator